MTDPLDLAARFAIPALGAIGGWFWSAVSYKRRLEQLEKDLETYKRDQKEKQEAQRKEYFDKVEDLHKNADSDAQVTSNDIDARFKDLHVTVKEIDDSFDKFTRASVSDFAKDAQLAHFIEEQNRQWQQVHRLLGQIEGTLKAQKRWSSRPPALMESNRR